MNTINEFDGMIPQQPQPKVQIPQQPQPQPQVQAVVPFTETKKTETLPIKSEADETVKNVYNQAVLHQVNTNEELRLEVLNTAEKQVKTEMSIIKSDVEMRDKEAAYNNNSDACLCYGYNEKTVAKWAVRIMSAWYSLLTAIWIIIASVTFMPVVFVFKKIQVAIKSTWLCIILAIFIYAGLIFMPWLLSLIGG